MMKSSFLKLFFGTLFFIATTTAMVSCVDDNDDTEAPFLEVSPTTLTFTAEGVPAQGSQSSFNISTNRHWKATVKDNKSWVTLSATEGNGSATIQVSIPENINDEANVDIQIFNKVGPLMTKVVTIRSGSVVPATVIYHETVGTTAVTSPYPFVDAYEGWDKTGTGAASVTYSGQKATIRASGLSNVDAYEGASGPNVIFFGTLPADFLINKISLTAEQTKLRLTFGASYSFKPEGATDYDNTFDPSKFIVSLSADGINWTDLSYTKNNGDNASPYWVLATANFTLKQATTDLYIKFTALAASAFRLDDITLATGEGGQEIDLGNSNPEPGDAKPITIPELNQMMTSTETPVDATADRYFEAIVQNDIAGGNYSFNNLILATENVTTAGNGVTLYGSQVEPTVLNLNQGDKVKVTLYKGLAKVVNYNGMYEVTGSKDDVWVKIEKVGTGNIVMATITADRLPDYQGMPVTIQGATPESAGIWASESTLLSHTFTAGGTNFPVFCKKGATAFIDIPFSKVNGSISGLAAVNQNKGQLVPRNLEDVKAFNSSTPTIVSVTPATVNFPAAGGTEVIDVEIVNQGSNTLSANGLSGILSAAVNGTQVTVTANSNSGIQAVNQTLTIVLTNGNQVTVPVSVAPTSNGNQTVISLDITQEASYPSTFPKLSANKMVDATSFTFGGYEYVFAGSDGNGYYQAINGTTKAPYIINGKKGAYIELPAVPGKKLVKVTVNTLKGASTNVMVGIADATNAFVAGGTPIQWNQVNDKLDYSYMLTGTAVNTKYRIYIDSAHNAQFGSWELIYE